jgi:hypothetical protein
MDAMDWPALFRGALWVAGLSLSLAAFSHMRWIAKQEGIPLRTAISWDSFLAPFFVGLALFAAGMAWGAVRLWETLAWIAIGLLCAAQAVISARSWLRRPKERSEESHEAD